MLDTAKIQNTGKGIFRQYVYTSHALYNLNVIHH